MKADFPDWLRVPPDLSQDHRYLNESEIQSLPLGIYYKRKSVLTRHRWIKVPLLIGESVVKVELIDNRGHWRISQTECDVLRSALSLATGLHLDESPDTDVLVALGLDLVVRPENEPIPAGTTSLPRTLMEMSALYENYTDMQEQGHFAPDSPDLDRLQVLLSWIVPASKVMDLGCNSGEFGRRLTLDKGCEVAGVDLSPMLVLRARAAGVDAHVAFAESVPFGDSTFDWVICAELLEHVVDPAAVLSEALRILKADGKLVGSVPHADGQWGHEDIGHHPEHLRAYDEKTLQDDLRGAGFRIDRLQLHYYRHDDPQEILFAASRRDA